MEIDKKSYENILGVYTNCYLKEDKWYSLFNQCSLWGGIASIGCTALKFCAIGDAANPFVIGAVGVALVGTCGSMIRTMVARNKAKDLVNENYFGYEDTPVREYTKDGRPIIDVEFTPVREGEESSISFEKVPEPQTIDVDFTPCGGMALLDRIDELANLICDTAYDGYKEDLSILDDMYYLIKETLVDESTIKLFEESISAFELKAKAKYKEVFGKEYTRKLEQ